MRAYNLKKAIINLFKIKQPLFIWGPPGVGKSQVVAQAAKSLDVDLRDVRAALLDPVDLRGLPSIDDKNFTTWSFPDFLPHEGEGILFLDEINAAPPLVQASCYQLILDRRIGEYILPEGWFVVAAGNRNSDRAVTNRISSALANRFTHIEFEVSLDDWTRWAHENMIREEVISFLRFRPNLLHNFDPQRDEKSFPTPRSWEFVSNILNSMPENDILYELIKGTVGEGACGEFTGYLRIYKDLPDPDLILQGELDFVLPLDDPAILYALSQLVASKADVENVEKVISFASSMPKEFEILIMKDAVKKDKNITGTEAFSNWAVKNAEIFV